MLRCFFFLDCRTAALKKLCFYLQSQRGNNSEFIFFALVWLQVLLAFFSCSCAQALKLKRYIHIAPATWYVHVCTCYMVCSCLYLLYGMFMFVVPQVDLRRIQDVSVNGFIPHPMCVTFITLSSLNAETSKYWWVYIFLPFFKGCLSWVSLVNVVSTCCVRRVPGRTLDLLWD